MKAMSLARSSCALALLLATQALPAAGAAQVIEGRLSEVHANRVVVDHEHTFRFEPANAKCFDHRGDTTSCETLVGIGYADRARVTIVGDLVQRIEIIELQQ